MSNRARRAAVELKRRGWDMGEYNTLTDLEAAITAAVTPPPVAPPPEIPAPPPTFTKFEAARKVGLDNALLIEWFQKGQEPAAKEGWGLYQSGANIEGQHWQIGRLTSLDYQDRGEKGRQPISVLEAERIAFTGKGEHHALARRVIAALNPDYYKELDARFTNPSILVRPEDDRRLWYVVEVGGAVRRSAATQTEAFAWARQMFPGRVISVEG